MTNQHGDFIWYELMTSNTDGAADFYGKVVGWNSFPSHMPDMDYRFISAGDGSDNRDGVGGYLAITPEMAAGGARSAWVGYIGVDDVDATVTSIEGAGGAVLMPAMDMAGVGRMAMVADPQGAPFYVMKGATDDTSYAFAAYAPKVGHCAWNELATSDTEGAKAFYSHVFGWSKGGEMDMGPMGTYEFLLASGNRFGVGAVMPKLPDMPMSMWTYYFRVPDIDTAIETIKASGGQVLQDAIEIPGGDFSLIAMDPQGAVFGLVGARA